MKDRRKGASKRPTFGEEMAAREAFFTDMAPQPRTKRRRGTGKDPGSATRFMHSPPRPWPAHALRLAEEDGEE